MWPRAEKWTRSNPRRPEHRAKPGQPRRGLPRAPGRGWGRPGSGGRNSPWPEARRGRLAGWDARPVSRARRAGSLSTGRGVGGGVGEGEAGGASAAVRAALTPPLPPPSSSCPPHAGRRHTPSRPCRGASASARSHLACSILENVSSYSRALEYFRASPPWAVPFLSGLVLESERARKSENPAVLRVGRAGPEPDVGGSSVTYGSRN